MGSGNTGAVQPGKGKLIGNGNTSSLGNGSTSPMDNGNTGAVRTGDGKWSPVIEKSSCLVVDKIFVKPLKHKKS